MFKVTKATGAYAALVSVVSGTIMWYVVKLRCMWGVVLFQCKRALSNFIAKDVRFVQVLLFSRRFNFRPLGLFFCSALAVFWARQYAHLRLQISPLFEEKLRNGARRALELRAARPGLFCALISGLLVLVAVIGHVVSAPYIVVTLLVLSIVISTKYDIKIVADREPGKQRSFCVSDNRRHYGKVGWLLPVSIAISINLPNERARRSAVSWST